MALHSVPWYSVPLHGTIQVVVLNDYHIHMKYEYMVVQHTSKNAAIEFKKGLLVTLKKIFG